MARYRPLAGPDMLLPEPDADAAAARQQRMERSQRMKECNKMKM